MRYTVKAIRNPNAKTPYEVHDSNLYIVGLDDVVSRHRSETAAQKIADKLNRLEKK